MPPLPRVLIVNADDFGLSAGVNQGIVEAHRHGIVTSTSFMVRQPAAHDAARLAKDCPSLSVGLHLDLCEWVYANESWAAVYEVVPLTDPQAVRQEIRRQLDHFQTLTGQPPTHLDSHQHIHRSEPVRSVMLEHADRLGIPLRSENSTIHYCGRFYGQSNKGDAYPQGISTEALVSIIQSLPSGITELGCHPAGNTDFQSTYQSERLTEWRSLRDPSVRQTIKSAQIRLCGFQDASLKELIRRSR